MTNERKLLLIVDDDERYTAILGEFLKRNGFEIVSCPTPEEARGVLNSKPVDLALVDWMLPGQTGPEFIAEMRKSNLAIPILLVTANGDEEARGKGFEAGADEFIRKPFNPRVLLQMILNFVNKPTKEWSEECPTGKVNNGSY